MKIRKLELQGFKSFADRATLHFGPGISGVVGPNGCGKSNIVDAVRWCIGEQSAKSLRGDSMSDVIFAGTATRQGVSFAEVSLTFVADPEPFPGIWQRFAELDVTRRLYRDGNSDYLINNERVRLRDIHDLFLDTGVGNRLYSFIEQGRIGQIVHARPTERRSLIEEAAGISRYKIRREESLEKLAQTREALEKVSDLHDDLGRRLKAAEKQVQRALRAQSLAARLRQEELALALGRFGGLAADRKVVGERVRAAAAELDEAGRAVARNEEELDVRRRMHEAAEAEAGRLRDRFTEIEGERRVEESARQYQERERMQATARLAALTSDHEEVRRERDAAAADVAVASEAAVRAEGDLSRLRAEADEASRALQADHAELTTARQAVEGARREAQAAAGAGVAVRGRAAGLLARRQELDARIARQQQAAGETVGASDGVELERALAAHTLADASVATARAAVEERRGETSRFELSKTAAAAGVRSADARLTEATRERERLRARVESLAEMERRDADLPDGVRAALTRPDARGLLGRELRVPAAAETAVARALDGALDAVLVADAAAAVSLAAAAGQTRLRVLALGALPSVELSGFSAELPGSEDGRQALGALLPDVEIVADVHAAYAAWSPGKTLVTREGAVLRRDGLLVLGAESGAALASVRRRREIEEVGVRIEAVPVADREAEVAVARHGLTAAEAAVVEHSRSIEAMRGELRQAEAVAGEARHRLREVEAERLRASRAAEAVAKEAELIAAAEGAIEADRQRAEGEALACERRQQEAEEALRARQVAVEGVEPRVASSSERAQRLRFECQAVQSRTTQQAELAATGRGRVERAERRMAQMAAERTDLDARLVQVGLEAEATRLALQRLGEEAGVASAAVEVARGRASEEKERVRLGEGAARAARDRRDACKDRHVEAEGALARIRREIDTLLQGTEERHGLSLPALLDRVDRDGALLVPGWEPTAPEVALGAEPVATLRLDASSLDLEEQQVVAKSKLVESLNEQLFKIGETNPEAIAEFHAEKGNFDEIDRQRADLVSAMEVIESALAKVNQACRERFRDTFDRVNEHFAEIYPRLVGGGSARLELTDDEDLLTCGVEMLVQPPGKKVQHLALLSGGEKAMAAIGLIFALFRVKPSPFCLLDEVDAPLDEGNGARFNDMLKQISQASQFIVVTHNKKTMEAADVLYGITMPEPGASRLVTVRLEGT